MSTSKTKKRDASARRPIGEDSNVLQAVPGSKSGRAEP